MRHPEDIATTLLGVPYESLDEQTKKVTRHVARRTHIARNLARDSGPLPSAGQRAADAVARFGGSWAFVGLFSITLLVWVGVNAVLLMYRGATFDP